jgi:quercetin dioxygenase-like cupin family protein
MGKGDAQQRVERWSETRPAGVDAPTTAELSEVLRAEGYRVYEWTDPAGTKYETHKHSTDQSHWVIRGALALEIGGREHVLGPGDRDWLPAGTAHSARVVGEEAVTYLVGERHDMGSPTSR